MPKFVDSSYVIHDVKKLQKDVEVYHNKNIEPVYHQLKQVFLEKELDNYENISNIIFHFQIVFPEKTEYLDNVWQSYRSLVDSKQFFITQNVKELKSVEELLDKCSVKANDDKELLQVFLTNKIGDLMEKYKKDSSSDPIYITTWNSFQGEEYMKEEMKPYNQQYQTFVVEEMSRKYEKLYKNFAGIFFKVVDRTMDMKQLEKMLTMINKIESNQITQHNASVELGKELGNKYIKVKK